MTTNPINQHVDATVEQLQQEVATKVCNGELVLERL
jgi:hypothetical protein